MVDDPWFAVRTGWRQSWLCNAGRIICLAITHMAMSYGNYKHKAGAGNNDQIIWLAITQ